MRGGSFASTADLLRLQHREHADPGSYPAQAGFRVARNYSDTP
jgi:formylglycine-generating enzyme required for sulfatase activity